MGTCCKKTPADPALEGTISPCRHRLRRAAGMRAHDEIVIGM